MDEDMVERLLRDYRPLVYATARRMCPRDPRDEDLLQCGMIGLWRAAEAWDQKRPFGALARRYVQGEMADYLRRKNRRVPTVSLEEVGETLAAEDDHSAMELADAIARAWSPDSREAALLTAAAAGASIPRVGKALGLRPARARATARRAARRLRGML